MLSFLSEANFTVIAFVAGLVAGVVFGQKIKDWFLGVPSELRTALGHVETAAKAELKTATSDVLAKITPLAAKPAAVQTPPVVGPTTPLSPPAAPTV